MAKKQGADQKSKASNVAPLPTGCPAEGCGKKATRASFCAEHFIWFKEGLINRQGEKPKDFDKKYIAFQQREKAA